MMKFAKHAYAHEILVLYEVKKNANRKIFRKCEKIKFSKKI